LVRYLTALLLITTLSPGMLAGQEQEGCTYYTCALRLRGGDLLAGVEGERITSFGFLSGPQLRPWMEVSDSASYYVDLVGSNYVSGKTMSLVGTLMWVGGVLAVEGLDRDGQRAAGLAVSLTGLTLFLIGNSRVGRAGAAMQSAIWWYNASLVPEAADTALPIEMRSPSRPVAIPGNHARTGTALGSVAGALGGLAATSGMDSSQTGEGLSITLALTAVGALIGHHVGKAIGR
jgi:hypothetical protein